MNIKSTPMTNVLFIVGLAACFGMLFTIAQAPKVTNTQSGSMVLPDAAKPYTSPLFKLSFAYPARYSVSERLNDIVLTSGEQEIIMRMAGSAGQTTDPETYIKTLETQNGIKLKNKTFFQTTEFRGYRGTIADTVGDSSLFFVVSDGNGIVYTISTNNPKLADDIEIIVGSLRRSKP